MDDAFPVDLRAHLAAVGSGGEPLDMCAECTRVMVYGALWRVGANISFAMKAKSMVEGGRPDLVELHKYVSDIELLGRDAMMLLTAFSRSDFEGSVEGAEALLGDEWQIGAQSFFAARMEQYVNDDGTLITNHHQEVF